MTETGGSDFLGRLRQFGKSTKERLQRALEQKVPWEEITTPKVARVIKDEVLNPFNPNNEFSIVSVLTKLGYPPNLDETLENLNGLYPREYPRTRVALSDLTREKALIMTEREKEDSWGETMYYRVDDYGELNGIAKKTTSPKK